MKHYDVIIIGAGPGGIFAAYELVKNNAQARIACFEKGAELANRRCPIDGKKIKSCIHCPVCSIMSGFGGAGAFSDGKYNITNEFGGNLYEYIGRDEATELMKYVDEINMSHGGEGTRLYSTADTAIKKKCFEHDLKLLGAQVRHLGTDKNYVVLQNLYDEMKEKVDFYFRSNVDKVYDVSKMPEDLPPVTDAKARYVIEVGAPGSEGSPEEHAAEFFSAEELIISIGRSGSKWMETVCDDLGLEKKSNRVDIGIRVELPHEVFSELTDELYESKIVYRTKQYNDLVRTFCMNPHGVVVNENTNGIVTVNGHSYEDPAMHTENTNFALLVTKHFTEPFKESNDYGESIA
ncbi:MAG: FAD-dependent oxidoreductase, partial [Firmicutes bacterium]|nr:FAD-dependent oxidoreductase [Bacillota bacterium]